MEQPANLGIGRNKVGEIWKEHRENKQQLPNDEPKAEKYSYAEIRNSPELQQQFLTEIICPLIERLHERKESIPQKAIEQYEKAKSGCAVYRKDWIRAKPAHLGI